MFTRLVATAVTALSLLAVPAPVAAQSNTADQEKEKENKGIFRWSNRPSIRIGDDIRLDLRLKLQSDWRKWDPEIDDDLETRAWRARRAGVNGEITRHVEFQIERDIRKRARWRDVFANWRTFRQAEVMVGRFKVPFGHEELIGTTDQDFAFRTLVSTTVPPARDKGIMVHGRPLRGERLTYQIGFFEHDGDNGRLEEEQFSVTVNPVTGETQPGRPPGIGHSFAVRVTGQPLRGLAKDAFDTFTIGGAYGAVDIPEGLNSLRGTSAFGTMDFVEPVYVKGRRQRYAAEVSYMPGPIGLRAEWIQAREERRNQGLGNIDLSDFLTTGWYASATWLITGEDKDGFDNPRHPVITEGIGAIEVGARYETLTFESAEKIGPAFPNPRAEHFKGNSDSVWTLGVTWSLNRWLRVMVNGIREEFEDPDRTPKPGTTVFWAGVLRTQLVF